MNLETFTYKIYISIIGENTFMINKMIKKTNKIRFQLRDL